MSTLKEVRQRGQMRVAVSRGIRGLSLQSPDGSWGGLDVDIARAVSAAVLDGSDARNVSWQPVDPADRLRVLAAREVDLVTCNLTWTLGREATFPVLFAGVTCYDGEGFLVREADGFEGPSQLAGRKVAVQAGTTSTQNLASWYGGRGLEITPVAYPTPREALAGYASGACSAYVLDRVALAGERASLSDPEAHRILDQTISREPMAAAVRDDDAQWFRICRWVLNLLISAEYAVRYESEDLANFVRTAGVHGPALGLDTEWAARVLGSVGHYGDIYERNLGASSGLSVPRGLNELWLAGGLHYAFGLH